MYSASSATADSEGVFSSLNPSQFMSSTHHFHLNPTNIDHSSTSNSTTGGFQMDSSSSIRYQNNPSTTSMLPGFLGYEINHQVPQQHSTASMSNFTSYTSYGMNSSSSSDQQLMLQPNSWQGSNINKPQNQLHLSNNAPFWNASPPGPIINQEARSNLFPTLQMHSPSSALDQKPKVIKLINSVLLRIYQIINKLIQPITLDFINRKVAAVKHQTKGLGMKQPHLFQLRYKDRYIN